MHPGQSISRVLLNHPWKVLKRHVPIAVQGQLRSGVVTMKVPHFVMRADFSKFPITQFGGVLFCSPSVGSLKLHNAKRPLSMKTDVIKKRQRGMDVTHPRSIRVINHQFEEHHHHQQEQQQPPSSSATSTTQQQQQQPKHPSSSSTSSNFRSFVFPA